MTEIGRGLTRRRFLGWAQAAMASVSVGSVLGGGQTALAGAAGAKSEAGEGEDYYAKLGVLPIINAAGTYTYLTAAVMPSQVRKAVERAALHPVRLKDLQRASGEYLARKLRCEAALVSSGAAAALTLATAACVAKANGFKPGEIPERVPGAKIEVIVQKAHRYEYDHAMTLCGVSIREVVTAEDFKRAVSEKTVMTNFFNSAEGGQIGREEWVRLCHDHGVPCHNDAAADMPPIENLWKLTGMGFDLVCFSGGKGIRGPQNAGLLLGRKDLIALAGANDSPQDDAVGRGMKVAKEQIVGMVAAVDWLLDQTETTMQAEWIRRVGVIQTALNKVPTVETHVFVPEVANHVPHLVIRYDPTVVGMTPAEVAKRLREETPSIELNPATGTNTRGVHADERSIVLTTWMLQPGEDRVVAKRLRAALMGARA
jgi:L-seryl-tRNA(Ser) seleniumtransferase